MTVKTKKRICVSVGLLCGLAMLGIIGGMELGDIPLLRGAALAGGCEAVSAAALWKAGWLRWRS